MLSPHLHAGAGNDPNPLIEANFRPPRTKNFACAGCR